MRPLRIHQSSIQSWLRREWVSSIHLSDSPSISLYMFCSGAGCQHTDLLRLTLTFQPILFLPQTIFKSHPPHIWSFSLFSPTRKYYFLYNFRTLYGEFLIQQKQLLMLKSEKISKLTRTDVSVVAKFQTELEPPVVRPDIETFKDRNFCLCFDNDDIYTGYCLHKKCSI